MCEKNRIRPSKIPNSENVLETIFVFAVVLLFCLMLCFFAEPQLRVQGLRRLQARCSKIQSCAKFFRSSGYASDRKSQLEPHVNNLTCQMKTFCFWMSPRVSEFGRIMTRNLSE